MAATNTQSQASLASLPLHMQSDTHITSHLASRFHSLNPTATISSHALISINTFSTPAVVAAELEALAGRMYRRLGARGENQAAVFIGEAGSGKTTLRNHLIQAFLAFSETPLSKKVSQFAFLFDALTSTKSHTSTLASKAGLFLELQYDGMSQTLIGCKLLDHRLERSRVANVPTGERNFHILYYLLAGTSAAEKAHLGLDGSAGDHTKKGVKRWRYLGHPTQLKVGVNDPEGFAHFKTALRKLEFPRSEIAEICQILASILHIGQLEFASSHVIQAGGDESVAMEGGESVIVVKNKEVLKIVAAFLGVSTDALEQSLGYKTKTIKKERVTIMLDANGARDHADELARTLYSMLVAWIIESGNERMCAMEDGIANTISLVDFPGFAQASSTGSTLDQLLNNAATESIYNFCLQSFFENKAELLESEEVAVEATSYFDNSDAVKALLKNGNGLLSILDDQTRKGKTETQFLDSCRKRFENKFNGAIAFSDPAAVMPGSNFASKSAGKFTVRHFAGEVEYPVSGLLEENGEVISADLMNLFQSTTSEFVNRLFKSKAVTTTTHARDKNAIMSGQLSSKPLRAPSVMRKKGDRPKLLGGKSSPTAKEEPDQGAAGQYLSSLDIMTKAMSSQGTNPYFIFCLKPNDRKIANQFDSKCVRTQIRTFGIAEISQRIRAADFSIFLPFGEFLGLADSDSLIIGSEREKAEQVIEEHQWPENEARIGTTGIFLSERCWEEIARLSDRGFGHKDNRNLFAGGSEDGDDRSNNLLTPVEGGPGGMYGSESRLKLIGSNAGLGGHIYGSDRKGYFPKTSDDARSEAAASAFHQGDMFRDFETRDRMAEKGEALREQEIEEHPVSASRKRWLFVVWCLTFYVPDFVIKICGRMKRKDVREAWREKLAINILIWLSCAFAVFILIFFPMLICPKQHVFSPEELSANNGGKNNMESRALVQIRGAVYDLTEYAPYHYPTNLVPKKDLLGYGGRDATGLFPVQVSALCRGKDWRRQSDQSKSIHPSVLLDYRGTNSSANRDIDRNAKYHDFRYYTNDYRPDWWANQRKALNALFKVGDMAYSAKYVEMMAGRGKTMAILKGNVYDLTDYRADGRQIRFPEGEERDPGVDRDFMHQDVVELFARLAGKDITKAWALLQVHPDTIEAMETCLSNLFYIGTVDTRNSPKCLFAIYLLLAISIMLVSVILFKFLAALQFTRKNMPENLDKFIICQIPAYTEDEESLRASIDSLARMKYDDKRKLMVVICDGMIIGQGNDRPTPRIVLDILGVSEDVDPQPLSFESLGEGQKQHNMGKVYSGLYEVMGHIVPFLVIVKVGKPSEVARPGNRGKRDSQMLLMRFLHRVHYNEPMNPLELEMHHQIRNIIGVNPTFYDFLFQIDADTTVATDAATRMVAAFLHDTRIIALCGETGLRNAKRSFITMIQVYEYYISHNLAKAFESLFGSVTCLPGCFSMYRLHAEETRKPLFVSKEVVNAYAEIRVDTLHMKNLLHLGEDRYLTTLLLKHHPSYKTKYIFNAQAWTVAPESWSVFMSQRRRWINSTLHNLMELIPMSQLCGFCCFSMRFIVFLDLLSTIIQPVTVAYIVYLIVLVSRGGDVIPLTAFILLAAVYGLQAIIFIMRRKWEMIGWMIMYILAVPVFSFALPLYAFWHMDDFSWGNTRIVTGEKGKKIVISNEGKFDPAEIPRKKWEDYQAGLWGDAGTHAGHDDMQSEVSGYSYATKSYAPPMSEYNYSAHPGMQSRPMSTLEIPGAQGRSRSRLSLAPSELLSQRGSQFFPVNDPAALEMANMELPSDDAIVAEIKDILRTADLMTVTKKSVKNELERRFGVSLEGKRAYVNSATEAVLAGQL